MNENILNVVNQVAGNVISNNPDIPQEKTDTAIESVSQGIFNGLKNEATSGGLGQIISMFKPSGNVSGTLTQNVQDSVVTSLMDKVGIKNETARQIASTVVPLVLNSISKLGKNSSGGFNVQNVLNSLTGGKTNGIDLQELLNHNLGGEDGKFDLNDLKNMVNKGGQGEAGNLIGELGHLFGKN